MAAAFEQNEVTVAKYVKNSMLITQPGSNFTLYSICIVNNPRDDAVTVRSPGHQSIVVFRFEPLCTWMLPSWLLLAFCVNCRFTSSFFHPPVDARSNADHDEVHIMRRWQSNFGLYSGLAMSYVGTFMRSVSELLQTSCSSYSSKHYSKQPKDACTRTTGTHHTVFLHFR